MTRLTCSPVDAARSAEALQVALAYEDCRNRARDDVQRLEANGHHPAELRTAQRRLAAAELQLAEANRQAGWRHG